MAATLVAMSALSAAGVIVGFILLLFAGCYTLWADGQMKEARDKAKRLEAEREEQQIQLIEEWREVLEERRAARENAVRPEPTSTSDEMIRAVFQRLLDTALPERTEDTSHDDERPPTPG